MQAHPILGRTIKELATGKLLVVCQYLGCCEGTFDVTACPVLPNGVILWRSPRLVEEYEVMPNPAVKVPIRDSQQGFEERGKCSYFYGD